MREIAPVWGAIPFGFCTRRHQIHGISSPAQFAREVLLLVTYFRSVGAPRQDEPARKIMLRPAVHMDGQDVTL
eukprot:2110967-Rhodomonas_salina.4